MTFAVTLPATTMHIDSPRPYPKHSFLAEMMHRADETRKAVAAGMVAPSGVTPIKRDAYMSHAYHGPYGKRMGRMQLPSVTVNLPPTAIEPNVPQSGCGGATP